MSAPTTVIDASVALKCVVEEPGSDAANQLLDDAVAVTTTLAAPEHLLGEVGHGLRKRVAQGGLNPDDAVAALEAIAALDLEFLVGAQRWLRSLAAALDWGLTTYDALYVLLALDLAGEFVTADERIVRAARAAALPVRRLGGGSAHVNEPREPAD